MANVYVRSGAAGAGTGADWANAYTTLAAAFAAKAAGDDFWVSEDHPETQATAMTLTCPGTLTTPCRIICVNHLGSVPPVSADLRTTATITTTGASAINIAGCFYCYGITFNCGTGSSTATMSVSSANAIVLQVYDSCVLNIVNTATGSRLAFGFDGDVGQRVVFWSSNISFGNASQKLQMQGASLEWNGGAVSAGVALPTTLAALNLRSGVLRLIGVDLSQLGSSKNLIDASTLSSRNRVELIDCKLGSSVSITTSTLSVPEPYVLVVNSDSADTHYRYYSLTYPGTITQETTIIRTGGANDGTQGFSRKFVSTANTKLYHPLVGPWFTFWLDTPGSVTAAIEIVTDNVTLTDAEAWIQVEALTNSGFPFGSFADDRAADILAAGTNQTTSSETWTTTGLGTPVKQTLSKAVTTAESGWVRARVCLAKASTTLYACPKILSTSQYQYMDESGSVINGPAAGSSSVVGHVIGG